MKALVTGGGGFLGGAIVRQLVAEGHTVRSLGRGMYPNLAALGVQTMQGDVRDRASVARACQDMDVVFHTAAVAGIWGTWEHFHGINTLGTQHVVDACQNLGVPRLVFTSSPSVTFDGTDQCNVDETAPYAPVWLSHYPHTKMLAERIVLKANGHRGLATCALRPHLIWGPGDSHLIPRLLDRARHGKLRRVGDGENLVDMIHVDNAADAHLRAAERLVTHDSPDHSSDTASTVAGKVYFLSQGEPVNCWNWINEILALANLPPVRRSISFSAAWAIGRVMETTYHLLGKETEPRMTRFLAAQLAKHHYFCIDAAKRDFSYRAHVTTGEGMQRLGKELAELNADFRSV